MPTDFISVLDELRQANVRYVLVGGLAVLLHGIDRLTADIDLVIDLGSPESPPNGRPVCGLSHGL